MTKAGDCKGIDYAGWYSDRTKVYAAWFDIVHLKACYVHIFFGLRLRAEAVQKISIRKP